MLCWLLIAKRRRFTQNGRAHCSSGANCCRTKKRKDEEKIREEDQKSVSRMISSAGGGTHFLHKITNPAAWIGGLQVLEELEDDGKPMGRCEEQDEALAM